MNRIFALAVLISLGVGPMSALADTTRTAGIVVNADDDRHYFAAKECRDSSVCGVEEAMKKCRDASPNPGSCRYAGNIYGTRLDGAPADSSCAYAPGQTSGYISIACQNPGKVNSWCYVGCGTTIPDANYKAKRNCWAVRPDRWECHIDATEAF